MVRTAEREPAKPSTVVHRYASRELPGVVVSDVRYRPLGRQGSHDHAYAAITLIVDGGLEEHAAGSTHQAHAASVVVKPAGTVHRNAYGRSGTRTLQLSWQRPNDAERPPWSRAFDNYRWTDGGPSAATMLRLYRLFAGDEISTELLLEECLCEMAAHIDGEHPVGAPDRRSRWLGRVVERLHDAPRQTPSVADLAANAGVHPVYLARAFRRAHRCTISQYVRRQRVAAACRRIAGSNDSLAAIALAEGFADQPHLCRVFLAEMGMTPGAFRQLIGR